MSNSQIKELENLSSYGILLVVLGHSYVTLDISGDYLITFLYGFREFIYSFHMPLFVFISGFLFIHTNSAVKKISYLAFVLKKLKRLILPYAFISTAAYPIKTILSSFAWNPVAFGLTPYLITLFYPHKNTIYFFWFLPTLFGIFLCAPIFRYALFHSQKKILIPIISTILLLLNQFNPLEGISFLNIGGIASYVIYFWMGCLFYTTKNKLRLPLPLMLMAVLLITQLMILTYFDESTLERLITAFCGIYFSYLLVDYITRHELNIFSAINGYSYQIYLFSWFFQVPVRIICHQALDLNFYISFVSMFLCGLFLPVLVAKLIRCHTPSARLLFGM